ncbi:MAG: alanine racemase [Candidatus Cloacimonadota bacterium]|nr:MAG: alanine racemase [Candidatus Cloacimonadota bacterium]
MRKSHLIWVEISEENLLHNISVIRDLIGNKRKLMAVVKSNAYGHGMLETAKIVLKGPVDWLGVNSIEEGIALRNNNIDVPVLVLGYVPVVSLEDVVQKNLRLTVYNMETVKTLDKIGNKLKKEIPVHIKIETGTNRQGINGKGLSTLLEFIKGSSFVKLEGISTHFANIEDTTDHSYAQFQLDEFKRIEAEFFKNEKSLIRHTACTAAVLLFPETYFEMVRTGIGMYGLWPSKQTKVSCSMKGKKIPELKPVLTWKTKIAQLKDVPDGSFISYGCTFRTTRDSKIAVLPVGYYEGYSRAFSNVSYVLVKGKRAPIRGRVCMNITLVDVTDIEDVKLEDEVVLLGKQGEEEVTADFLAELAGTINYEIVSHINPVLERRVV